MKLGKVEKTIYIVIALVAVVLAVCFLPLPRHVSRSVSGTKIVTEGRETIEEVQATISLDIWQLNYLFKSDTMKGAIVVSEPSGREMRFEVDTPLRFLEEEGKERLYWICFSYYNADKNMYEGAYMFWEAGFTDVRIEMEKSENKAEPLPEKQPVDATASILSMEEVKKLSETEDLTIEEVCAYPDLKESELGFSYYEFMFEGKTYTLDIYETSRGGLEGARLVDRESLLSIDIRTGNVEHLIQNTVSIEDYLSLKLPEGLSIGAYDMYISDFGGARIDSDLTRDEEQPCGMIRIMHGMKPAISGGVLKDVTAANNNVSFLEKESITGLAYPCLLTLMSVETDREHTVEWWGAYFAEEGCEDICYLVQFRADLFSREEVEAILKTISFTERAFY